MTDKVQENREEVKESTYTTKKGKVYRITESYGDKPFMDCINDIIKIKAGQ